MIKINISEKRIRAMYNITYNEYKEQARHRKTVLHKEQARH